MPLLFKKNDNKSLADLGGCSPMIVFAIGWENKEKDGLVNHLMGKHYDADLDLSCVVYDKENERVDCVWYAQLNSKDGAIRHKGDDTVGWHEGDDEVIIVDLNQLGEQAQSLFFVISSFSENSFAQVENAYLRIFDGQSKREIGRFNIDGHDTSSAKIAMRLKKTIKDGLQEWRLKAFDEPATGQNVQEVFAEIRSLIDPE